MIFLFFNSRLQARDTYEAAGGNENLTVRFQIFQAKKDLKLPNQKRKDLFIIFIFKIMF